jgi:trehalose synthase
MIEEQPVKTAPTLDDYATLAHLVAKVADLRAEAASLSPKLSGRTVWMVNSTAQGGGVAEMMPHLISMLRELGVDARWAVMGTERIEFFTLTKRIHNAIHGVGEPSFSAGERALYDAVSKEVASELTPWLGPDDVLVVHDPQPAGLGARIHAALGVKTVWRCHIGLDEDAPPTHAAWEFLRPYVSTYDRAVFSAPEYVPHYLSGNVSVIAPGIDPLSHKNRELSPHKLVGVLCNASLLTEYSPVLTPAFSEPAKRLQPNGRFEPAVAHEDVGVLFRPTVTQISRWDRLKGWRPLLDAFVQLKRRVRADGRSFDARQQHRLEIARLVLAGPAPEAISDDPEGVDVLHDLVDACCALEPDIGRDVALLTLPMSSRKENALMVNALQRCATVVVQNSLREGFGLTVAEAMWKRNAVLGTSACGIRQQIRHGVDGYLIADAEDTHEIADALAALLDDPMLRDRYARSAQRRVHDEFLVFEQVGRWLRLLSQTVEPPRRSSAAQSA